MTPASCSSSSSLSSVEAVAAAQANVTMSSRYRHRRGGTNAQYGRGGNASAPSESIVLLFVSAGSVLGEMGGEGWLGERVLGCIDRSTFKGKG